MQDIFTPGVSYQNRFNSDLSYQQADALPIERIVKKRECSPEMLQSQIRRFSARMGPGTICTAYPCRLHWRGVEDFWMVEKQRDRRLFECSRLLPEQSPR